MHGPDESLIALGRELFANNFGPADNCAIVFAPGRVNFIGEHTDYNGGFVMPMALQKHTVIVGKGRVYTSSKDDPAVCRVVSKDGENGAAIAQFHADDTLAPGQPSWVNYVKGVVAAYLCDVAPGQSLSFDAAVVSDIPLGGGLSSSAALEVAVATLLEEILGKKVDGVEKALRCQSSDHNFVGCPCGIMDQFASVLSQPGCTLLLDCENREFEAVPLDDPDVVIVVANSGVRHALAEGAYGERVVQCQKAVQAIQRLHPAVTQLRHARQEWVEEIRSEVEEKVFQRATHVVSEDRRTLCCASALRRRDYSIVGDCMNLSHASLRDDYEVSCEQLEHLVEIALSVPGVYGARMTGGGFGGCTVTLVARRSAPLLLETLKKEYPKRTGLECMCFVTDPQGGAGVLVPFPRQQRSWDVGTSFGKAGAVVAVAVAAVLAASFISFGGQQGKR